MRRWWLLVIVLVGVVFAGSLGGVLALWPREKNPLAPDARVKDLKLPPFQLKDQDGKAIDNSVFTGRVTIVDFFFTHCKLICPVLTQHMADQQRALKGTSVRLLSVSVDPEHDTAEVLRQYAADHGADTGRWTFATGDRQTLGSIVTGGMQFDLSEDTREKNVIDLGGGKKMNNIVHPSWLALIGPKGDVLGIYLAEVEQDMAALTERARAADRIVTNK